MSIFFPPTPTAERRGEIIVFKHGEEKSLYNTWERLKRLLKICPMHGIDLTTQMDIFYHAMNYASKGIIDASCCGAFKIRNVDEVRKLIEDLSKCNYKAPSEALGSNSRLRRSCRIGLDRMRTIEAKVDAVMNKLGNKEKIIHTAHEVGAVK